MTEPAPPQSPPDASADAASTPEAPYRVFLSHNSREKPAIMRLAEKLKRAELEPWLDAWCLTPGRPWQEELAAGVHGSSAFAFFVGPNGQGDWAREELDLAHDRAAKDRDYRLFPVLLPGLPEPFDASTLPPFLRMRTWVDLRAGVDATRGFQDLVCAITGVPFGPAAPFGTREDICPYRGLLGFDEDHADFYFGRDREIQRLLEKLKTSRFLAVLGPSGSGKSSVVRAGLVPALRRGAMPGTESWTIRVLKPGVRPLVELAAQIADAYPQQDMAPTLDRLMVEERSLDMAVTLGQVGRPEGERVVWVVDQFEEIFTVCQDEREREMFLANLLYAASVPGGRSVVVLTMRADFYLHCAAYPELAGPMAAQQFLVSPMDRDELRKVIEEPALRVGLEFEAGLVGTILQDVEHQPGALPLLEHALLEMWGRRRGGMLTLEGYRQSGGVNGAIAQRADAIFVGFSPEQQAIAQRILLRLTQTSEGTADTRRRASLDELVTRQEEREAVEAVVHVLVDARLLTTSGSETHDERRVDISHEALIRFWPRLRSWLDDDREALRIHRRLTEAAQDWRDRERDEGLLFRGVRLDEATGWRQDNELALNDLEREFLDASVEHIERERARIEREREARERLRRRITIGAVTVAVLGLLLSAFAGIQWQQAEEQRGLAEEQRGLAEQRRVVSLSRQLAAEALTLLDDRTDLALLLSLTAEQTGDTLESRRSLLSSVAQNPRLLRFLHGHTASVDSVAYSPDGRILASGGTDNTIRLWDVATGQQRGQPLTGHTGPVLRLAFGAAGRLLASASSDRTLRLWDPATGRAIGAPITVESGQISSLALSPDGRTLASGSADLTIHLWDANTGTPIHQPLTGHTGPVSSLAFSADGGILASGSADKAIRLWDVSSGQPIGEAFTGHTRPILSVALSPDGTMLASGGADNGIRLWDIATGAGGDQPLTGHTGPVMSLAFSPDGGSLASGSVDRSVRLWALPAEGRSETVFAGHIDRVNMVTFSPDGQTLVSASADQSIRLWDIIGNRALSRTVVSQGGTMPSAAIGADGQMLASSGDDGSIHRWNAATGQPIGTPLAPQGAAAWSVALSPDTRTLASGGLDGSVQLWDSASGQPRGQPLTGHTRRVSSLVFSPDGTMLASLSLDGSIRFWAVSDGSSRGQPIVGRVSSLHGLAFSPDSKTVAAGSASTIMIWDVATGEAVGSPLAGHGDDIESVAFSPDGKMLASGGLDRSVRLWDIATGAVIGPPLAGHTDDIESVAFSPDGRTLASGGLDSTVRLWDVATGQVLGPPLTGHTDRINAVAFNQDGRTLISGSDDGTIRVWETNVELWSIRACRVANRNLHADEWSRYMGEEPYRKTCPDLP